MSRKSYSQYGDVVELDDRDSSFGGSSGVSELTTSDYFEGSRQQRPVNRVAHYTTGSTNSSNSVSYAVSTKSVAGSILSVPVAGGYYASSESWDPILEHFASYTPPSSSYWQISNSRPSTISASDISDSDRSDSSVDSHSEPVNLGPVTPATSDTGSEADAVFVIDQNIADDHHLEPVQEVLHSLTEEFGKRVEPLHYGTNYIESTISLNEICQRFARTKQWRIDTRLEATTWIPDTKDDWAHTSDDSTLVPAFGLVSDVYHTPTKTHTHAHHVKVILARHKQSASLGPLGLAFCGSEIGISDVDVASISSNLETGSEYDSWDDCHEHELLRVSKIPNIYGAVDLISLSFETLASLVYPGFAYSHLSRASVMKFTTELKAPNKPLDVSEHDIRLSFGFGPAMPLHVCVFVPRKTRLLHSYRVRAGEDILLTEESLPIFLNLFIVESHAKDIDDWLESILNSASALENYAELVKRRQKIEDHQGLGQVLTTLVEWYSAIKGKIGDEPNKACRASLKLLMTTTLSNVVPKITHLPSSLSEQLVPQTSQPKLSLKAPKLLTRQIKASVHHLQHNLLQVVFCHLSCELDIPAEVRAAMDLLIAYVLDSSRRVVRKFAQFASKVEPPIVVDSQDMVAYEENMVKVFERLRAGSRNSFGDIGLLGTKLKGISSIAKGKSKEVEGHARPFVSVIMNVIL